MKQIEVSIMGQSYLLGCPEGGEPQLRAAVQHVDREMCAIRDSGKLRARERIAVLAALNLAFELACMPRAAPESTEGTSPVHADATSHPAANTLLQTASSSAYVDSLIARVDAALNHDGHLL